MVSILLYVQFSGYMKMDPEKDEPESNLAAGIHICTFSSVGRATDS